MIYFKKIAITAVASTTRMDDGLESSKENPKRLLSVLVQVQGYGANDIQGWWEREKIFDIPDSLIDTTYEPATSKHVLSMNRLNEIEVGMDLPVGSTFKLAIKCGTSPYNIVGAYRYEIAK